MDTNSKKDYLSNVTDNVHDVLKEVLKQRIRSHSSYDVVEEISNIMIELYTEQNKTSNEKESIVYWNRILFDLETLLDQSFDELIQYNKDKILNAKSDLENVCKKYELIAKEYADNLLESDSIRTIHSNEDLHKKLLLYAKQVKILKQEIAYYEKDIDFINSMNL